MIHRDFVRTLAHPDRGSGHESLAPANATFENPASIAKSTQQTLFIYEYALESQSGGVRLTIPQLLKLLAAYNTSCGFWHVKHADPGRRRGAIAGEHDEMVCERRIGNKGLFSVESKAFRTNRVG